MQLTLAILCVGINAAVIIFIYRRLEKKIRHSGTYDYILEEVRKDVDEIIVGINQTTERNVSLLEDRIKKVHNLLALADKRITLLGRDTVKPQTEVPLYTNIRKKVVPSVVQTRKNQKLGKKEQVLDLHRNGFAPGLIAAKVGISIGEVELIISLSSGKDER